MADSLCNHIIIIVQIICLFSHYAFSTSIDHNHNTQINIVKDMSEKMRQIEEYENIEFDTLSKSPETDRKSKSIRTNDMSVRFKREEIIGKAKGKDSPKIDINYDDDGETPIELSTELSLSKVTSDEFIRETVSENSTTIAFNISQINVITPNVSVNISNDNDSSVTFGTETPFYINSTKNVTQDISTSVTSIRENQTSPPYTSPYDHPSSTPFTNKPDTETPTTEETTITTLTTKLDLYTSSSSLSSPLPSAAIATTDKPEETNFFPNEQLCIIDRDLCKGQDLTCYGSGVIDCGDYGENERVKRSANDSINDNYNGEGIISLALEASSPIDNLHMTKCALESSDGVMICIPQPLRKNCIGRANCVPPSAEIHGPMKLWKVGLIAGMAAAGGVMFIIVVVIAYVSWNKLKVRPEVTLNGYQNNPQSCTRV